MKRSIWVLLLIVGLAFSINGFVQAQEADMEKIQLTRDEMLSRIKGVFQHRLEVLATMPDIKQEETSSGIIYVYKGTNIEALDDKALFDLLKIVNSQLSWHNLQRLQKQLKDLKKVEEANKGNR